MSLGYRIKKTKKNVSRGIRRKIGGHKADRFKMGAGTVNS